MDHEASSHQGPSEDLCETQLRTVLNSGRPECGPLTAVPSGRRVAPGGVNSPLLTGDSVRLVSEERWGHEVRWHLLHMLREEPRLSRSHVDTRKNSLRWPHEEAQEARALAAASSFLPASFRLAGQLLTCRREETGAPGAPAAS